MMYVASHTLGAYASSSQGPCCADMYCLLMLVLWTSAAASAAVLVYLGYAVAGQQKSSEGRPPWDVAKRLLAWMFNGAE